MGNDGGSIPTRRELVKSPTRAKTTSEVRSANSQNSTYHWTYCPLSKRPLEFSIVSDALGRLFNKDAVLEWLINPEALGDGDEVMKVSGVKSLKDVVDVKFEIEKASPEGEAGSSNSNGGGGSVIENGAGARKERWVCPISRKELGPGAHAVYLVPCGHAFAESAVKEIKEDECLVCSEKFEKENVIKINPTEAADLEKLKARKERLLAEGLSHSLKKLSGGKKRKNKDKDREGKSEKEGKLNGEAKEKREKSTANDLASKVLGDEQERTKRRKMEMSENVKSLFTSSNKASGGSKPKDADFMTRGFTMPVKGGR